MLERASARLEYGSCRILQHQKPKPPCRHSLHSSFWHHGRGDLDLGYWWTSVLRTASDPESRPPNLHHSQQEQHHTRPAIRTCNAEHHENVTFLDFLYPHKTIALIQRLSTLGIERWDINRLRSLALGPRNRTFSSNSNSLRKTTMHALQNSEALKADKNDLRDPHEPSLGSVSNNESRLSSITFDESSASYRQSSRYEREEQLGVTVSTLETTEEKGFVKTNSKLPLREAFDLWQWDLALRVFSRYVAVVRPEATEDFDALWEGFIPRRGFLQEMNSLLDYAKTQVPGTPHMKALGQLISHFLLRSLSIKPLSGTFQFARPFQVISALNIADSSFFESLLTSQLAFYYARDHQIRPLLEVYLAWRSSEDFRPSRKLLRSLLERICRYEARGYRMTDHRMKFSIDLIIQDLQRLYGHLDVECYGILLQHYSQVVDVDKVHLYFAALRKLYPECITLEHVRSLLMVHARRGETGEAQKYFEQISQIFGLHVDIKCWNMLLYAYARKDDLDGAITKYEDMIAKEFEPDQFTLGTLASLYASRGDVDAVEHLIQVAREKGVPVSPPIVASHVLAYVRRKELDKAEKVALRATEEMSPDTARVSFVGVWNHVLTAHALEKNPESAMRILNFMEKKRMKLNGRTYSALMFCLTAVGKTELAHNILKNMFEDKNNPPPQASYYAIIMRGYMHERQLHLALDVENDMKRNGVRPTVNTQAISMRLKALMDKKHARELRVTVQEQGALRNADEKAILADFRRVSSSLNLSVEHFKMGKHYEEPDKTYPAAFLQYIVNRYGPEKAYKVMATNRVQENGQAALLKADQSNPRVIYAFMRSYFLLKDYEEVKKFWQFALENARTLVSVRTLPHSLQPADLATNTTRRVRAEQMDNLENATEAQHTETPKSGQAASRLDMLSSPLRLFLFSLIEQGKYKEALSTVSSVLAEGFTLDNLTWNLYIQTLVDAGRVHDAFTTCEKILMPHWPGWRESTGADRFGCNTSEKWLPKINPVLLTPNSQFPTRRTMFKLAHALQGGAKKRQKNVETGRDGSFFKDLKQQAPATVAAISVLPKTNIRSFTAFFHSMRETPLTEERKRQAKQIK